MKNLFTLLLLLTVALPASAALRRTDSDVKTLGDQGSVKSLAVGTQLVDRKLQVLQCRYDFAVDGGAVGTLSLREATSNKAPCTLPNKAVIWQVAIDVITAFTSTAGTGTIALQANSAGDLLAAVDADTLPTAGATHLQAGIPVGTAGTMIKATAARDIKMVIATNPMLSGKANVFIEYFYKSE